MKLLEILLKQILANQYYLCGNYFCSNGIIKYQGNLDELLNINLYIGESLLDIKRIIEHKIDISLGQEDCELINNAQSLNMINFGPKKEDPFKMYSYKDLGILVNE